MQAELCLNWISCDPGKGREGLVEHLVHEGPWLHPLVPKKEWEGSGESGEKIKRASNFEKDLLEERSQVDCVRAD